MKSSTYMGTRFLARVCAICAAGAVLVAPASGQEDRVKVSEYGRVDIAVSDTDLVTVLEMLSIQGRKNIVASPNVSATVSANLYDVTFYEALDAILRINGYIYVEEGNFIYVYTQEEGDTIGRTESRIYNLKHLSADDAMEFITPLLSSVGKAAARGQVQAGFQPGTDDGGADTYAYNAKIVVNDRRQNLDAIEELLVELDIAPQQVLVESTILQTTTNEDTSLGIDFSIIDEFDFTSLTAPLSPVSNLLAGADPAAGFQPPDNRARGIQQTVGNTSGPGGFKAAIITDNVSVFLKLLDEVTDITVLARPKLMALNRQRAEVLVGARVGYLSTTSTQTTSTQTVQFLDTGIQLVFRPFISDDGSIRMELSPSVSVPNLRETTDANGQLVTIPDELTNELTTNVRLFDGQTLVLGGLFQESTTIARRHVPLLGDVPLLGLMFRGQDDTIDRSEIIFMITPTIMHDERLWELGNEMLSYTDSAMVGARKGLLPFGRTSITSNYNRDAVDAWRAGNIDLAMHFVNNSLRYDPDQPEIRELRREINGEQTRSADASLLERACRRMLGPLPRRDVRLPREVAVGAGSTGMSPMKLDLNDQGPWSGGTDDAKPVQVTPNQPKPPPQPVTPAQPEQTAGTPKPPAPPVVSHPVTERVPKVIDAPSFWRAGDPAGLDDPAFGDDPFAPADDLADATGN